MLPRAWMKQDSPAYVSKGDCNIHAIGAHYETLPCYTLDRR